jgi:sugar/nucleoside kinase (ribokinase family)
VSGTRVRPTRLVRLCGALLDVLLYIEALPERGGDTVARRRVVAPGGGFNMLVGAARLGLEAAYAGLLGDGPFATRIAGDMAGAGVAILLDRVKGAENGFAVGLVEPDGERTFVGAPGVEAELRPHHLASLPWRQGDSMCVSGYDLCYPVSGTSLARWASTLDKSCLLVFDPGPLAGEIPSERLAPVLARADVASLNAREANLLTGRDDASEAAGALAERLAPRAWAIVRSGADGCWIASRGLEAVHVPGRPAEVVDTTGAGDAHVAALLARLAAGDGVVEAARWANIAASMTVEEVGPSACPTAAALAVEERRLAALL